MMLKSLIKTRLKLTGLPGRLKDPKILAVIGMIGVIIIGISSCLPKSAQGSLKTGDEFDCDEYRKLMEENVRSVVLGITGDKKSTVVITLKNGIRYSYADDTKTDSSKTDGEKSVQSSSRNESSHITVKTSSGEERALVITENMPEIRGVAIVCAGGDDDLTVQEIKASVMAALDITEKRIYVTARY